MKRAHKGLPFSTALREVGSDLTEELREAYTRFLERRPGTELTAPSQEAGSGVVCISWIRMLSRGDNYLLGVDRELKENLSFEVPIFLPRERFLPASECLVLGHGFNESDYVKLFPWAYWLCKELSVPVIIFPCAFHINRRPGSWARLGRDLYHRRKRLAGNRASSPFNAVVSQRISEAPERFLRGALQSYQDLVDLLERIRQGTLEVMGMEGPSVPFAQGATPHFLGYSISGYLFLGALLMDEQKWLKESNLVLFNSFSAWDEANPVSVLVVDQEAYDRGTRFYLGDYLREASEGFRTLYEETQEGILFRRLFLRAAEGLPLKEEVATLRERLLVIADPHDPIFPGRAIGEHLGQEIPTVLLNLGRHEFPFNLPRTDTMGFHQLGRAIRGCWAPAPAYQETFCHWLSLVGRFLQPCLESV